MAGTSRTSTTAEPAAEKATEAAAVTLANGQLVAVLDADGNPVRYGFVVDADGREPNLEHRDPISGQPKPESREPVVLWLTGEASPYGGELTAV